MKLSDYLAILWRRKWVIVLTASVAASIAILAMLVFTPQYEASTTLRMMTVAPGDFYDITYTDRLMNTYATVATSRPTKQRLMSALALSKPPQVDVEIPANTELLVITVGHPDPVLAMEAANTLAEILRARVEQDEQFRAADGNRADSLSVVEPAVVPISPSSPRSELVIGLGLLLGLMGGLGLAFFIENLDDTLYSTEQVEDESHGIGLPVLASIPRTCCKSSLEVIVTPHSQASESIHALRTRVQLASDARGPIVMVVTSPEVSKGSSLIAANLALSFAQGGQQVVLVDGNLRHPRQHDIFGWINRSGLSTVLAAPQLDLEQILLFGPHPKLQILLAGPEVVIPTELLHGDRLAALLASLKRMADVVIIDAPPLLQTSDAMLLSASADAAIIVTEIGRTSSTALSTALADIRATGANPLGVVLDAARWKGGSRPGPLKEPINTTESKMPSTTTLVD